MKKHLPSIFTCFSAFAKYSLFLLLVLPCGAMMAGTPQQVQQTGTLKGKITDDQGNPLPGANVRVVQTDNRGTTADHNGSFTLSLETGTYTVEATYIGYEAQRHNNVQINTGKTTTLDFVLKNTQLEEVVVVGYGTQKKVMNKQK